MSTPTNPNPPQVSGDTVIVTVQPHPILWLAGGALILFLLLGRK